MKLKELLEKYGDVEIVKEKEQELKNLFGIKESKKWEPNHKEDYFFVNDILETLYDTWMGSCVDTYRYFRNNCFKTRKEAEFHSEQIKVYNGLKNFAIENNGEIDWDDNDAKKWYICFNYDNNEISTNYSYYLQNVGQIYFTSDELAEQAIKIVGEERIKKYLCWS